MRKAFLYLLFVLVLTLSSCASIQEKTRSESNADQTSHKILDAAGQYFSLEEIIAASDVLLKGQCVDCKTETDYIEYEFEVLQIYRGRLESKNINVYVPYYNITIHNEHHITYHTDDIKYELGESYILALLDRSNVYLPSNRYINTGGNLYIPTSNIQSSSIYGESLLKHSNIGSLTTEESLLSYLCTQYDLMADRRSDSKKITYLSDTDFESIIVKSDYILQIKVADEVYVGSAKDRKTYDCIITDAIHGNIKNGETARILFPADLVKSGDELIVALFEFENTSPRSFVLSSKSSVFSIDRKSEIIESLNG